jgi:hypothetical protein
MKHTLVVRCRLEGFSYLLLLLDLDAISGVEMGGAVCFEMF